MLIPDCLRGGLRVVFCGTALGAASDRAQAYYAGPGNKFWATLEEVGLTPRRMRPEEYRELLDYEIGLTDLCKTRSGSDLEIGEDAFDLSRLVRGLEAHKPGWIAFNGKKAAMTALGRKRVEFGRDAAELGGVPVFILPSTSGAANGYWDISYWRELAALDQRDRN